MRVILAFLLLSCLLGCAFAVRSQWNQMERANPSSLITVRFALTQSNLDVLESTLLDISDIHSKNYGKWWTAKDITELVAPSQAISSSVATFLKNAGASKVEDLRDVIKVTAKVSVIESLLQTTLFNFQHVAKSRVITKAVGTYAIPSEIAEHVDFVSGLYEFPSISNSHTAPASDAADFDGFIVPATLNSLYGIPTGFHINANSSICLVEFQDDQSYSKKDLKDFTKQNAIPDIDVVKIVGPFSGSDPDAESTLDVEFGGAIAQSTPVWFWTVADWMYDFATDFLATENPPLVVSMSWGWPEPNQCDVGNCTGDETSKQYVERTNVEFQKIGAIGVSLFAASGDQGAPGDGNPNCGTKGKTLSTIFPGASPWVVSVGATQLTNSTANVTGTVPPICKTYQCASSTTEEVCSYPAALITTGGGFSNYVPTPSYQSDVVAAYLKSGVALPPSKTFNAKNRGFPDVSALGHNYLIAITDDFEQVDGTSCSSPVFAAIIALLNSYRLDNGKAPLGFAVPLLYQAYASDPTIFNDITTGNNKCTESCCAKDGYLATKGWDPVTGLGTPNFAKLLAFVKTLP